MSKLQFRARALDPSKPMPIYLAEELPDLPEYSAINRAVPQMPSGMEKEEESEHHLQRAICTGLIIPTPEVFETDRDFYERNYPPDYKMPRQLIHMQPLSMEQDIPDYDMDSSDECWVNSQSRRLDLTALKFEQMMDRLEKSSGQTVVTLNEAKALLKQDDEVSIAVYDYWLNKRLKMQHPLILSVKTENRGGAAANNPYLAFRRRTEKMQTRKNRKNDETSYEKMLKLRRDLSRAVTLLEMIKRREKAKREQLHLGIEIFEKRYQARDFSGQLLAEYTSSAVKNARPAFAPLYTNQYSHATISASQTATNQWTNSGSHHYTGPQYQSLNSSNVNKRDIESISATNNSSRKEKRQYKKRKHKQNQREKQSSYASPGPAIESMVSSEEDELACNLPNSEGEDEGMYTFRRIKNCQYNKSISNGFGNWPWASKEENGLADPRYRFTLASVRHPRSRCIGFVRRRMGRGGRVTLDRITTDMDDMWSKLDYKIFDSETPKLEHDEQTKRLLETNLELSDRDSNSCSISKSDQIRTPLSVVGNISDNNVIKMEQTLEIKQEILDSNEKCIVGDISSSSNNNLCGNRLTTILSATSSGFHSQQSMSSSQSTASDMSHTLSFDGTRFGSDVGNILQSMTQRENIEALKGENFISESYDTNKTVIDLMPENQIEPVANALKDSVDNDQIYTDFLDDIRRDWLHFRPKTPSPTKHIDDLAEEDDMLQLTESTPLNLEVQTIGDELPSSIFLHSNENVFQPNPFSLADIIDEFPVTGNHDSSGMDMNMSGDSLNELSLSLSESTEDNEKMLDNILQECQIEDLKSFHTNANFWNGILEDTTLLSGLDTMDDKKVAFDKSIGYNTDFVTHVDDKTNRGGKRKNFQRTLKQVGSSQFLVSNLPKDDVFKKSETPALDSTAVTAVGDNTQNVTIKEEPVEEPVKPILQRIKTESGENLLVKTMVPAYQTGGTTINSTPENTMIVMSNIGLTKKHVNGPSDKNVIQNFLKTSSLSNRMVQSQKTSDETINIIPSNNLVVTTSTQATSNHNYSLPHNSVQHPITVIGQPGQANKVIINSSSFINPAIIPNASNLTLSAPIQELLNANQNKIQINSIPASNIKVNLMSATNNQQDLKSIIAGTQQQLQHQQQQQQQQQHRAKTLDKTMNVLFEPDKNRILYANIKNRQPFLAQINPKMVNILPIQHNKNSPGTIQSVVTSSAVLSKPHTVQRITTIPNSQTINTIRQSGDGIGRIVQNSDNTTVSTININTTNR